MRESLRARAPIMQKTRKSNGVVRRNLTEALLQLLDEKRLDEITVTELVARAQVARVSFYRNFDNLDEVLMSAVHQMASAWLESTSSDLWRNDRHAYLLELLREMYSQRRLVELLIKSDRIDVLRTEFNTAFGVGCPDRRESARRAFLAGGLYNLVYRWAVSDFDPSPEVLADFVYELLG